MTEARSQKTSLPESVMVPTARGKREVLQRLGIKQQQ
jgi:hypothetical protein